MRVCCYIGKSVQFPFAGYSLAGLFSQPDCVVTLEIVDWVEHRQCMAVDVDGARLAIEVFDQSDEWDLPLLEWCDVYAKRNIDPLITTPLQGKIVPFGMNVACHSRRSAFAALGAIAGAMPSGYRPIAADLYRYLVSPHWADFEYSPELPVNGNILYQTRVWEAVDAPNDEGINEERVALLRALRAEFGQRVVGGLVPTEFAKRNYPELITHCPTRQPQYIQWAKRHGIAVYSRGLFGSIAFKMPEYLAAAKCIVADPVRYTLPAAPDFIPEYETPEACVALCQELLTHPGRLQEQREASWEYYTKYVRPPTAMRRLLEAARERRSSAKFMPLAVR